MKAHETDVLGFQLGEDLVFIYYALKHYVEKHYVDMYNEARSQA